MPCEQCLRLWSLTSAALDIAQVFTWLCARLHAVSRLAGAKVLLFSEPPKLFGDFFQFLCDFPAALDKCQVLKEHTPYYILYRERILLHAVPETGNQTQKHTT